MTANFHVIVGLGVTGVSCARFLKQRGIPFAMNDTRENPALLDDFKAEFPDIQCSLGQLDEALFQQAAVMVLSPGIALADPIIAKHAARGLKIIGDIELFATATTTPIIAITGTNAKSTVTTLVGEMAKAAGLNAGIGGNLGVPALDLLVATPEADVYVLELSSFQLETTYSLNARVATVLNITPDHMDRYATLADYTTAKARIYHHAHIAICNRDDPLTENHDASQQKIYFTANTPNENEFGLVVNAGITYLAHGKTLLMPVNDMPVKGKHYQINALSALAMGFAFGMPMDAMLSVLTQFNGLPHRCQFVRRIDNVDWYNDSKGTNVGATLAAIEGLGSEIPGKLIIIAGGLGKNADFSDLITPAEKYARHLVLIGKAAPELEALFANIVPTTRAKDMAEAVQIAASKALADDSVLLSPACASMDMFKNFEHRGQVFTDLVENLNR